MIRRKISLDFWLNGPGAIVADVVAIDKAAKKDLDQRMINRLIAPVCDQIFLGRVGDALRIMDKNMIPGLIALGLGLVRGVPTLLSRAAGVQINNNAAIAIPLVFDQLTRSKKRITTVRRLNGHVRVLHYHHL